jgi:hypothetical protein
VQQLYKTSTEILFEQLAVGYLAKYLQRHLHLLLFYVPTLFSSFFRGLVSSLSL